ncbi:hypothetical protein CRE_05095 [Caenorhabditis remanei]|uniref:Uncharacterized protein n=1 Tax=Caenorhabditis remanei TaxID=31234 RepID=E3MZ57_CAERE|nr:hypothetical protein CRE_05095 [Caenorhabditis remanei]
MILVQRIEEVSKKTAVCFLITSNIIFVIIPVYFMVVGLFSITKCPGNQFLPFWLIGVAILIIIDRVMFWKILVNETNFEKNVHQKF